MSESSNNGHSQWDGSEIGKTARQRLDSVGNKQDRHSNPYTNGDGPEVRTAAESKEPPHNVKRHPEDPPGAYEGAATEICDPERIRAYANQFGKASQAIDPEWFEWLVRPLYKRVHDIRIGAIVAPSRREFGDQLKQSASTEAAIAKIQMEGIADNKKANRLESDVIPRVERELMDGETKLEKAEGEVEAARDEVSRVRAEEDERQERIADAPRRSQLREWAYGAGTNLFSRVNIGRGKAAVVFGVEVVGSAWLLAADVADVIGVSLLEGGFIAAVVSIALLAAAFAAGLGLAAIRLPGWLVGTSVIAAFGAILVKFVPGMDALREADESGVVTLTAATLATFMISMVSGYSLAISEDGREVREADEEAKSLRKKAGTPLGDALEVLGEKREKKTEANENRDRLTKLLEGLWEKVENLKDKAERADGAAEQRRQDGIEADVEAETIRSIAEARIEQEEAAAEWAYLIALAAQEKARAEEPPKVVEVPGREPRPGIGGAPAPEPSGPSLLLVLALLVAAASGISSLFLGLVPLGIGIPVAALLALLDRLPRRGRGSRSGSGATPAYDRERIVAVADEESPQWVSHPDHMVPKYRDGGAAPGERQ